MSEREALVNLAKAPNAIEARPTPEGYIGQNHDDWLRSWGSYLSQVRDAMLNFSVEVLKNAP